MLLHAPHSCSGASTWDVVAQASLMLSTALSEIRLETSIKTFTQYHWFLSATLLLWQTGDTARIHTDKAWYGMVWCGVVWYGMAWCGMVWYGVV